MIDPKFLAPPYNVFNMEELAKRAGMSPSCLKGRIKRGWRLNKALVTPVAKYERREVVETAVPRTRWADHSGETYQGCLLLKRVQKNSRREQVYLARCHCKNEFYVYFSNLKKGTTKSCGCFKTKKRKRAI